MSSEAIAKRLKIVNKLRKVSLSLANSSAGKVKRQDDVFNGFEVKLNEKLK